MEGYVQKYWKQVDLHSHTTNEITRDKKNLTNQYTHKLFYDYVQEQGVSLKAVSNHNTLNLKDHVKHALICEFLSVNYIPGVEVDYLFGKKPFHAVSLLSPMSDIIGFSNTLSIIVKKILENSTELLLKEDDFSKLHANTSFIFIPHAKKIEGFLENKDNDQNDIETTEWMIDSIKNGLSMPLLLENTKDYHKYSVIAQINERIQDGRYHFESLPCIVNTDYKFDSDEDRKTTILSKARYYIFAQPTYRGLEISIRNHESRFSEESNIIQRNNFINAIKLQPICNDDFSMGGRLDFSPGLNIIIGNSGTGKTLLLNEIFKATNDNVSLTAVRNDDKVKTEPYESKIKGIKLLDVIPEKTDKLIVIEIPKIYNEILKAKDAKKPAEKFGIDDYPESRTIMLSYISTISEYEQNLDQLSRLSQIGSEKLRNTQEALSFIFANKVEKSMFLLSEMKYNSAEKKLVQKQIDKATKYIEDKNKIYTYFNGMKDFVSEDYSIIVDKIIRSYNEVLSQIENSKVLLNLKLRSCITQEQLYSHINKAISGSVEKLGQRERAVREKQSLIEEECQALIEIVRKSLYTEYRNLTIDCNYPFDEIASSLNSINHSDFSRLQMEITEDELQKVELTSGVLLNPKNVVQKLAKLSPVNFLDSDEVKNIIIALRDQQIKLSDLLIPDVSLSLDIKVKKEWKNINEINPGDLAKSFMNFFFEKIIREKQPNVIVIDQPENDVDKTFITEVLSTFLLNQKRTTQFIITTHDPILAVNSDANRIILCELDEKNRINYSSFSLEETDLNFDYIGTDIVSQLLDGGLANIKTRYQIYGGSINE